MGKCGPKPKPDALRALEGNRGKRGKSEQAAPVPAGSLTNLKPPTFLPALAKKEWRRVVMELARLDLISDLDVMALAAYCNSYATWLDAIKQIKETGMLVRSPNGYPMPSPYVKIERDSQEQMMKWLREFGMTPSARTRVEGSGGKEEPDDPFAALAKRAADNRAGGGGGAA